MRVRELIGDAVRIRLESEVPLGVFLSGGLDSSIIVAEMAAAGVRAKTYSVGFEHASFDETRYARMVARHFGTDHHELRADQSVEETFQDFVTYYDEPFADSSALATLAVAKTASEHVTVILTGDGGDEMFGGYKRYEAFRKAVGVRASLGALAMPAALAVEMAGRSLRHTRAAAAGRFVRSPWETYRDLLFHFQPDDLKTLFLDDAVASIAPDGPVIQLDELWAAGGSQLLSLLWVDQQTYLPDDLLTKMDRATMAHSLEARSPLLDHDLATVSAPIPKGLVFQGMRGKAVVRAAYADVLPRAILGRTKMGFGVPLADWLRNGLRSMIGDMLLSSTSPLVAWLNRREFTALVNRFQSGDDDLRLKVWNLLALAGWLAHRSASVRR